MKKVAVLVHQIHEGLEYKGTIEFNRVKFNFELKIGVHLDILNEQKDPTHLDEKRDHHRNLFQITLSNEIKEIEIEDQLFGFLVGIITPNVLNYHNDEEIKNLHKNMLKISSKKIVSYEAKKMVGCKYTFNLPQKQIPKILLAS